MIRSAGGRASRVRALVTNEIFSVAYRRLFLLISSETTSTPIYRSTVAAISEIQLKSPQGQSSKILHFVSSIISSNPALSFVVASRVDPTPDFDSSPPQRLFLKIRSNRSESVRGRKFVASSRKRRWASTDGRGFCGMSKLSMNRDFHFTTVQGHATWPEKNGNNLGIMGTCGRGLPKSCRPADRVESSRYSVRRIPNGVKSFQNRFPLFPTQLAKIGMQALNESIPQ